MNKFQIGDIVYEVSYYIILYSDKTYLIQFIDSGSTGWVSESSCTHDILITNIFRNEI